jgi:hypothetical protein
VAGSSGVRSIAASMTENVADSMHQAASSARNVYASVVRELSQAEHDNVSTRVVGNVNHVRALTVQNCEVPQIYRTSVGLHRIEPCLFVTIKPIDFLATAATGAVASGDIVVRRCRNAPLGAALDQQTRSLLDAQAPESRSVRPFSAAVAQLALDGFENFATVVHGLLRRADPRQSVRWSGSGSPEGCGDRRW